MPILYQGVCDCGYQTAIMPEGYSAVLVDHRVEGTQHEVAGAVITTGAGGDFASTTDPRFVILSHPLESEILASTGYSEIDLLRQGRFVAVCNVICVRCGTTYQRRHLAAPGGFGCFTALFGGVACGIAFGIKQGSIWDGIFAWGSTSVAFLLMMEIAGFFYVRYRFAGRAASLAAERACPKCLGEDAKPVSPGLVVICPNCANKSLSFAMAGMS